MPPPVSSKSSATLAKPKPLSPANCALTGRAPPKSPATPTGPIRSTTSISRGRNPSAIARSPSSPPPASSCPIRPGRPAAFRDLQNGVLQHFLDTRAHDVTYSLVASTNFREYFPGTDPTGGDPHFQRDGVASLKLTVASSVRPLAPKLSYLIPAFLWTNSYDPVQKNWYTGRTVMLRAYFERPFLLSGNRETVGVVLFDPSSGVDPAKQNYVSRWGADPVRPITKPILQNELSEVNLCEAGHPLVTCTLPEGDQARIKPCSIHYSPERQLWYADVPINTLNTNTSFVRLAFVRFQPDSLTGGASEAPLLTSRFSPSSCSSLPTDGFPSTNAAARNSASRSPARSPTIP